MPSLAPRLSGPGELVAALPLLCGFVPTESLVVVCLEGSGSRVSLTARYDLPPEPASALLVEDVARTLRRARVLRAHAVVVTDEPGARPRARLAEALQALPVELLDVLLVREGRWWSYLCAHPACCPAEGTVVPRSSPALELVRARSVLSGRAVLADRGALVAALAPEVADGRGLQRAREALEAETEVAGHEAVRRRLLSAFRAALEAGGAADEDADDGDDDELVLALHDAAVRDEVLSWSARRGEELFALLLRLVRRVAPPDDAPVCACLAFLAWSRGDGATANVSLDRALRSDPGHRLALLLRGALDQQVRPADLRAVAARAGEQRRTARDRGARG